jgi:hypothetical protein
MRRLSALSSFALCLCLILAATGTSLAQGYGEALMNAIAYKAFPQGAAFRVQALDNSDENLIIKQEFERILQSKGFTVSDDAPLALTFETRNEIGSYKTRNKRAVLELNARGGREGGEDAKMRFNLFDSNTGGVFNQGKGETSVNTPSQYRLDVSIDSRTNGKRHWQAWTVANLDQADRTELIHAMLPEMVNNMGKTVKSHIIDLF